MTEDDSKKAPKGQYIIGADLEEHSVEALTELIGTLRSEIERIEDAITKKGTGREAAESLFKK